MRANVRATFRICRNHALLTFHPKWRRPCEEKPFTLVTSFVCFVSSSMHWRVNLSAFHGGGNDYMVLQLCNVMPPCTTIVYATFEITLFKLRFFLEIETSRARACPKTITITVTVTVAVTDTVYHVDAGQKLVKAKTKDAFGFSKASKTSRYDRVRYNGVLY